MRTPMLKMNALGRFSSLPCCLCALLGLLLLPAPGQSAEAQDTHEGMAATTPSVIDLTMVDYAVAAPSSIPSGWSTFRMENMGQETHEFVLGRLPEGKTFSDVQDEYLEPIDSLDQLRQEGTIDSTEFMDEVEQIRPNWVGDVERIGGGGLIGPGETAKITLNVKPGEYHMSCLVSSANGRSHLLQGMVRGLTVTDASSNVSPPDADATVHSKGSSVTVNGTLRSGEQTVAVHVEEPQGTLEEPYSSAMLARLGPETDPEDLHEFDANPPPTDFLGGALAVPTGQTAYVTVDLEPGRYAWLLPHSEEDTIVKEFTVE